MNIIKKAIHELDLNSTVPVMTGNPGDRDFAGIQLMTVERIHKTLSGWHFMSRMTKTNGDQLLCLCTQGPDKDAYYTTMAAAYGEVSGREREEAIEMLGFSPD